MKVLAFSLLLLSTAMAGVVDTDANNSIEFSELLSMMTTKMKDTKTEIRASSPESLEAFRWFDRDGNGFISAFELQSVGSEIGDLLSDDKAAEMIREMDIDGDGQISYEEFDLILEV